MLAQVRSGGINFFTPSALVVATLVPVAAINAVGFAFADYDQVWKAMDGELGAHVRAAHGEGRPLRVREDVGQRLPPDHQRRQADRERQGHGRPEDPRAGEPAQHLDVQGAVGASPTSLQFSEVYSALQTKDRRRAGKSAADHPGRQALRGAEVLLAHQPHLGRLLVHRQRPRLGSACPPTSRRSSPTRSTMPA